MLKDRGCDDAVEGLLDCNTANFEKGRLFVGSYRLLFQWKRLRYTCFNPEDGDNMFLRSRATPRLTGVTTLNIIFF
jgi:hypothetical protein